MFMYTNMFMFYMHTFVHVAFVYMRKHLWLSSFFADVGVNAEPCFTILHFIDVLLHHAVPKTFKLDTTLRRMKGHMCEWFPHAMQNVKHWPDHHKAWHHLRVKKNVLYTSSKTRNSLGMELRLNSRPMATNTPLISHWFSNVHLTQCCNLVSLPGDAPHSLSRALFF